MQINIREKYSVIILNRLPFLFFQFNMAREPATRHRICIHCAQPISALYREYSKGNIRLEQCGSMVCNKTRFADHYIENDPVVVFIDMILLKRPVFRHLIHNRLKYSPNSGVNNTVLKLALILILFEVYVKWFKLEKYHGSSDFMGVGEDGSLHVQYFWILGLCILESLIWHGTIRSATWLLHTPKMLHEASHADQTSSSEPEPRDIRWYNSLSMALIISSYGKLFLLLMAIWDYKELDYAWLLNVFVLVSNLEALSAYLHSGYVVTAGILLIGVAARVAVNAFWWWSGVNGVLFI
ncbi:Arv1-like family-domain-containing protein [Chytriomyces sp. MP71]|nr:Arv1-like family-domain-containing protein [Chytriomyces sp. MP71]